MSHRKHVPVRVLRAFLRTVGGRTGFIAESPLQPAALLLESLGKCPRDAGLTDREYLDIWVDEITALAGPLDMD